jgi:hypothetical protein
MAVHTPSKPDIRQDRAGNHQLAAEAGEKAQNL